MSDDTLQNELFATQHLLDCAEDWSRIARMEDAPVEVRVEAAAYARAVRAEGNLKGAGA